MNPQEVHAKDDETLLRIPIPFSIKANILGGPTWAEIKQSANDRHLRVSIRGARPSTYKSGNVELTGVKQQINIMKLNPGEPIPLAETLDFYEDLMDTLESMGIEANEPLFEEERHDDTEGEVEVYMHGRLVEVTPGGGVSPPRVTAFTRPLDDANARVDEITSTSASMSLASCARTKVGCGVAAEVDAAAATTRQQGQSRKHSQRRQRQDTQQKGRLQRVACRHRPS